MTDGETVCEVFAWLEEEGEVAVVCSELRRRREGDMMEALRGRRSGRSSCSDRAPHGKEDVRLAHLTQCSYRDRAFLVMNLEAEVTRWR
jgi:hypothetical protein